MIRSLGGVARAWVAALLGVTYGLVGCIETASLGAGPEGAGGEVGSGDAPSSTGGTSAGSVGGGLVGAGGGAAGAVAGGSGGSGGDIYVSAGSAGMPSCDVEEVLRTSCGRAGCHTAQHLTAGLDLETPGVQTRLIDVPATFTDITCPDPDGGPLPVACVPASCPPGAKLIDLANPESSWLLKKLAGTQAECGRQMPIAPGTLSDSDRTCLEEWLYPHPPVVR